MLPSESFVEGTMRAHALHLPHFHGVHFHLPRLDFAWPKAGMGFEIVMDLTLILVGAFLGMQFFVPGVLD